MHDNTEEGPRHLVRAPEGFNLGHHLESLAVTFAICMLQSLAVLGFQVDSWMHETANFLRHYTSAPLEARLPVDLVAAIFFSLNLIVVVIARRGRETVAHD